MLDEFLAQQPTPPGPRSWSRGVCRGVIIEVKSGRRRDRFCPSQRFTKEEELLANTVPHR